MGNLPLEGIRVLDITVVWAGPYATQLLADWGAEVIRVEPIDIFQPMARAIGHKARITQADVDAHRDWGAAFPNWDPGARPWDRSPGFNIHARNKKSMTLNIHKTDGAAIFDRLIALSDVIMENNVPVTSDKLGLYYERVSKINPGLVLLRMPGYGLTGPYRTYRTLGSQIDGVVGHTWVRGYPDRYLEDREDVYLSDAAGGVNGALAVMMALRHRRRTGRGQLVELSQVESFAAYTGDITMDYLMSGRVQASLGNRHPYMAPHGCYPCKGDDQWLVIAVATEKQWDGLVRALGSPPWSREERFSTMLHRLRHQDQLDDYVSEWTRGRDKHEAMHILQRQGVPAGAVIDQAEAHRDPHLSERRFFQRLTQADTGTHLYPGLIARLSDSAGELRTPPVRLGENNEYVYKELLGFTETEYRELERRGHIDTEYPAHVS